MDLAAARALAEEGYSRRKIARMLGVSRNTLRKYLSDGRKPAQGGKLAGFLDSISAQLGERPQSRAMDVFRALRAEGYAGSYDLVKRKLRALRQSGAQSDRRGKAGTASADLSRVETSVGACYLFTLSLDDSGRIYGELGAKCDLDAFFDWHVRAFRFFGGVPTEISYEKSRNRLVKAFVGSSGLNFPMARFAAHFGFRAHMPPPPPPWSQGRLKRPIRLIESLFLRGYPFQSIEGANPALLGWLLGREPAEGGFAERLAGDLAALNPFPSAPFEPLRPRLAGKSENREAGGT